MHVIKYVKIVCFCHHLIAIIIVQVKIIFVAILAFKVRGYGDTKICDCQCACKNQAQVCKLKLKYLQALTPLQAILILVNFSFLAQRVEEA